MNAPTANLTPEDCTFGSRHDGIVVTSIQIFFDVVDVGFPLLERVCWNAQNIVDVQTRKPWSPPGPHNEPLSIGIDDRTAISSVKDVVRSEHRRGEGSDWLVGFKQKWLHDTIMNSL